MGFTLLGILSAAAGGGVYAKFGYFAGGEDTTVVDKFAFPTDTRTTLATGTSGAGYINGACSNSGVAGYAGQPGNPANGLLNKFAFPTDTRTTFSMGYSALLIFGASNSGVAGYFGGGQNTSGVNQSQIRKVAFPSDTVTTSSATLSVARHSGAGFSNSGTAAYFAGGQSSSAQTTTTVDKIAFATDTRTTLSLAAAKSRNAGFSNGSVAGYSLAGKKAPDNHASDTIDKFSFPTDTRTALTITPFGGAGDESGAAMADFGVAGYYTTGFNFRPRVYKLAFATDTWSRTTDRSVTTRNSGGFADNGVL